MRNRKRLRSPGDSELRPQRAGALLPHTGSKSGIQAKHAERLRLILSNLDQAEAPEDMDLPGLASHDLKGKSKGVWSVKVSGNWRVTFRFAGGDVELVNYEDYH